jgi:hypothetical protein
MMRLGIFFGIHLSHGKGQVASTGIAGMTGRKMSTSVILSLNRVLLLAQR